MLFSGEKSLMVAAATAKCVESALDGNGNWNSVVVSTDEPEHIEWIGKLSVPKPWNVLVLQNLSGDEPKNALEKPFAKRRCYLWKVDVIPHLADGSFDQAADRLADFPFDKRHKSDVYELELVRRIEPATGLGSVNSLRMKLGRLYGEEVGDIFPRH